MLAIDNNGYKHVALQYGHNNKQLLFNAAE